MYSKYPFTLDIHAAMSQVSIPVTVGDTARRLYIGLTDGGEPFIIPDGCRAVLTAEKADGTHLLNDCIIEQSGAVIRYDFTEQTASAVGRVGCQVKLYGTNGEILAEPRFTLIVYEGYVDDDIISENEKTTIDNIILSEQRRVAAENARVEAEVARVEAEIEREGVAEEAEATAKRAAEVLSNALNETGLHNGSGELSVEQGLNAKAISKCSGAFGDSTLAGSKGFRIIESVDHGDGTGTYTLEGYNGEYRAGLDGDVYSVRINNMYDRQGTIEMNDGNKVTVNNFVADALVTGDLTGSDANTFRVPDKPTIGNVDIGVCSAAFGASGVAGGRYSTVFGYGNKADGKYSAAFGHGNSAQYGGFVAGQENTVNGQNAFSAGRENVVDGDIGTAFGLKNVVSGLYAFAAGQGNTVSGEKATAFGEACVAEGDFAFAGGWKSNALGSESFAFGSAAKATTNSAVAIGDGVTASGRQSVSIGRGGTAIGLGAFAHGQSCEAKGEASRAGGIQNHAIGNYSEAMAGQNCYANGDMSISTGISSIANGKASFAGGWSAQTDGELAFAYGSDVTASGRASVAFGDRTKAGSASQVVLGKYNVEDTVGKYALVVGNGTSETARSNAFAVDWNGNIDGGYTARTAKGTYTGTGNQYSRTLTFPFEPKVVIISVSTDNDGYTMFLAGANKASGKYSPKFSIAGMSLKIGDGSLSSSESLLDKSGVTYAYAAVG